MNVYRSRRCPNCRDNIQSRRHMRADYKLGFITSALFKDIDAFNKFEQEQREKQIKKIHNFEKFKLEMKQKMKEQERKTKQADLYDKQN